MRCEIKVSDIRDYIENENGYVVITRDTEYFKQKYGTDKVKSFFDFVSEPSVKIPDMVWKQLREKLREYQIGKLTYGKRVKSEGKKLQFQFV